MVKRTVNQNLKAWADVHAYLREIGSKGGKVGGKATGPRKARAPEHYAKMVKARAKKRKQETPR